MPDKKLSIPHPCALDWSELQEGVNGKYCNYCSREIIDFTAYSQQELLEYLGRHGSMVCGLFSDKQLQVGKKSVWRPMLAGGTKAAMLFLSVLGLQRLSGQTRVAPENTPQKVNVYGTILDSETRLPAAFQPLPYSTTIR